MYTNATYLKNLTFSHEYIRFKSCMMDNSSNDWRMLLTNSDVINADAGYYGELSVKTGFHYHTSPVNLCGKNKDDSPKVVYLVLSSGEGEDKRQAIRKTFGSKDSSFAHRVLFFVFVDGQEELDKLKGEHSIHGDLVLAPKDIRPGINGKLRQIRERLSILSWTYEKCEYAR